jgi:GrpB-like predicted nucleotidyltransferase (UPF0157 family)
VFLAIEHFGSTSVPGLAAKPIIDLMVAADEVDLVAQHDDVLCALGYHRFDTGMRGRLFYLLRDYLRAHPGDSARYAALKRQLASVVLDGDEYTRAKTDLVRVLTDAARAERGLQSVPVWEE